MNKFNILASATLILIILSTTSVYAGPPGSISMDGYVFDTYGNPVALGTNVTIVNLDSGEIINTNTGSAFPPGPAFINRYKGVLVFNDSYVSPQTVKVTAWNSTHSGFQTTTATKDQIINNFNITIDAPPQVQVVYPNGGERINHGDIIEVSAAANDDVSVENVTFFFTNDSLNWCLIGKTETPSSGTNQNGVWNFSWDTSSISYGTDFKIKVNASDSLKFSEDESNSNFSIIDGTPPLANASANMTVIGQGEQVLFNGSNSSDNVGIVIYNWDFNDSGATASGNEVTHSFVTPGVYVVTLNVSDAAGNYDTDTVTITVWDTKPPVIVSADINPLTIISDGKDYSTLNVSATDEYSGIGSVSINLSELGGESNRILDLNGSVYETKINSTINGTFNITINATDNAGNSNISEKILLMVIQAYSDLNITYNLSDNSEIFFSWDGDKQYNIYTTDNYTEGFDYNNPTYSGSGTFWKDADISIVNQRFYKVEINGVMNNKTLGYTSFALNPGWNLVSIPLNASNGSLNNVIKNPSNLDMIYRMAVDGKWITSTYYSGFGWWDDNPEPFGPLNPGKSYWIRINSNSNISIVGEVLNNKTNVLEPGWNFVSWPFPTISNISTSFVSANITDEDMIYKMDSGGWKTTIYYEAGEFSGWYGSFSEFEPNEGYWFFVKKQIIWNVEI